MCVDFTHLIAKETAQIVLKHPHHIKISNFVYFLKCVCVCECFCICCCYSKVI